MIEENSNKSTSILPLSVFTVLFFMWGFLTSMNDILIPFLKGAFDLSYSQALLVQFCFFGAYFVGSLIYFLLSVFREDPLNKIGYKNGIILGLLISALGAFLFVPAAKMVEFPLFLGALFILGLGLTLLQISANPYVSLLGPQKTSSARLNLSQGFNSIGTTIAPLIGGTLIFKYFGTADTSGAEAVIVPYIGFGAILLVMAMVFFFIKLPDFKNEVSVKGVEVLKSTHLLMGMIAIFMYVGSEVSVGSFIINFLGEPHMGGYSETEASLFVALYWGGLLIGRFMGAVSLSSLSEKNKDILLVAIPLLALTFIFSKFGLKKAGIYGVFLLVAFLGMYFGKSKPARTTMFFAGIAVLLLALVLGTSGWIAVWAIVCLGLFNSIMWSNIFTLSIKGLKQLSSQGSSLLVMMIVGGALFPLVQAKVADFESVHASFIVPLLGYLYIFWYGFKGHKLGLGSEINE